MGGANYDCSSSKEKSPTVRAIIFDLEMNAARREERKPKKSVAGRTLNLHKIVSGVRISPRKTGIYGRHNLCRDSGSSIFDLLPRGKAGEEFLERVAETNFYLMYPELYLVKNHEREVGDISQLYS